MKNKGLILVVTLIVIAAILVSGGTAMAGGWHGGGGHWSGGWHGPGFWRGGWGWGWGHWRGGWGWGWGWPYGLGVATGALLSYPYYYQPYYAYDPYAYAPRMIASEREPAYADERAYSEPARGYSARGTWYYCKKSNAYYPYVRRCAGGWEKVPAVPPSSEPDNDR